MTRGPHSVEITLRPEERETLRCFAVGARSVQALEVRAPIFLACADRPAVAHDVLAAEMGVTR